MAAFGKSRCCEGLLDRRRGWAALGSWERGRPEGCAGRKACAAWHDMCCYSHAQGLTGPSYGTGASTQGGPEWADRLRNPPQSTLLLTCAV